MLLALEIFLTIWVWNRGWKAKALLPVGLGLLVAVIGGMIVGSSGGANLDDLSFLVIFDVLVVVALAAMGIKGRDLTIVEEPEEPIRYASSVREPAPEGGEVKFN